MLADAKGAAASEDIALERRVRAVRFLRGGSYDQVAPTLTKILGEPAAPELHVAAIETFTSFDDAAAAEALLAGWSGYGPQARQRAVDALIRRTGWVGALLDAVEGGAIAPAAVDPVAKIRLAEHPDEQVSARAAKVLGAASSNRAQVVEQFQDVLALEASAQRGEQGLREELLEVPLGASGARAAGAGSLRHQQQDSRRVTLPHPRPELRDPVQLHELHRSGQAGPHL